MAFFDIVKNFKRKRCLFKVPVSQISEEITLQLSTDEKDFGKPMTGFELSLTEKEKEEFEKCAKLVSSEQNVPLYTFRCDLCNRLFLINELGGSVFLDKRVGRACKLCISRRKK